MKRVAVALGALALVLVAYAVQARLAAREELDRRQRLQHLERAVVDAYRSKDWQGLAASASERAKLEPAEPRPHYDLACAHTRLGERDSALAELAEAVKRGEMGSLKAMEDLDLAPLRGDPRFDQVLESMRHNAREGPADPAAPIAGVKTVEGYAEDGYRFRVRQSPTATAQAPNRLLVYLHPSHGPFNAALEDFAPELAAHGWAVLVVTRKQQWDSWSDPEFAMLERTWQQAGKLEGVDARKPVLVGFSAGGQELLLQLGKGHFAAAGIVLDAAYPLDRTVDQLREVEPPAHDQLPLLVLVGADDPGTALWRSAAPKWADAGVPLELVTVPGRGHAWLLDDERLPLLLRWLDALPR